jgi:hypothetical protein
MVLFVIYSLAVKPLISALSQGKSSDSLQLFQNWNSPRRAVPDMCRTFTLYFAARLPAAEWKDFDLLRSSTEVLLRFASQG